MIKTIFSLAFVIILGLILINRERVYLRDPLATTYRNDVEQSGIEVYQNYSNDILMENNSADKPFRILIQHWNQKPGTPLTLTCMRWMACLANGDQAATQPLHYAGKGKYNPQVFMTKYEVTFTDIDGTHVRVKLR